MVVVTHCGPYPGETPMIERFAARLLACCLALAASLANAADLPHATPGELGFSPERLDHITAALTDAVQHRLMPGAVLLIARHGKIAYLKSVGSLTPDAETPMPTDALFRIYSMSKPVTIVAALMLAEQGRLTFDEPIAKLIPAFTNMQVGVPRPSPIGGDTPVLQLVPADRPITVQDLMRHTSGMTYGIFGDTLVKHAYLNAHLFAGNFDNAEFADRLARLPLAYQPGTTWDYSHSTDILGRVIEVASGETLYNFEKENLLDPLGMSDTSFYVTDRSKQPRIAEPFPDDRTIGTDATVNDPRAEMRWESGGGGMVSTASDYARFLQMLLNGGTLEGRRYLSPHTVAYMTSDQLGSISHGPAYAPGPGYGFGLGVAVRIAAGQAAYPGSVGDWYWGGAAGTYFWADPKNDMFTVFMMQSPKNRPQVRSLLRDLVYAALIE
jgi:CubicO group peptidase (beta-lactamase class C family)